MDINLPNVPLTRTDLVMLAAVTHRGSRDLRDLFAEIDYLDRSELTFDQMSYGLGRLVAAGLVETVGSGPSLAIQPTAAAESLARHLAPGQFDVVTALGQAMHSAASRAPIRADQSRLPGLTEEDFGVALAAKRAWWDKVSPKAKAMFETEVSRIQRGGGGPIGPATRRDIRRR